MDLVFLIYVSAVCLFKLPGLWSNIFKNLLTSKAETCSTVHKVPSLWVKISRITFIQLICVFFNIISFAQASIILTSNFIKKNQVFGHKKSEKSTRIFLNTDFGKEKNPLTGNTYIYQQKNILKVCSARIINSAP